MTDLKNLPQQLNEKKFYDMAVTIRKYQDYKTDIVASKLDGALSLPTRKNYVSGGVTYLKEGKKTCGVPALLCKALDKVISECVQPLRPSKDEKRREYNKKYTRKTAVPPVARLDIVKKPVTVKLNYGIKLDDSIKCFPSYDEAAGFLKGIQFMGNTTGKMVSFEGLEEVK